MSNLSEAHARDWHAFLISADYHPAALIYWQSMALVYALADMRHVWEATALEAGVLVP
jgi:hypothetical protein